ncbi:MAG: hypothetical protein C0171_00840 [Caldisphaera sp.]|uniref:SAM hydrolase/SAM-dependent halogenase family protein n=1 Tax=Caldisphaera sp. TaxID=2060322 RepID=UPI000CC73C67|nr:MAG: hypothetical protein C0201_03825 [Caldisphaera sp.]PMP92348.1 MAG: hypothetical protein C0171_00840 [Caldisphaera sp.]
MNIGIITDFGNNFYVGIMKGIMKKLNNDVEIIDIDNNVPKFSILSGSYILFNSYKWMPKNSIILSVVDPGVGTKRKGLIVKTKNYYFVGPDNGLLYESAIEDGIASIYEIIPEKLNEYLKNKYNFSVSISQTFHGRDIFAPTAALLSINENLSYFTKILKNNEMIELKLFDIKEEDNRLYLKVIYIDDFGNIVLSSKFDNLDIKFNNTKIIKDGIEFNINVGKKFADVDEGQLLLYKNSFGFAEIAVNKGNASNLLNSKIGNTLCIVKNDKN